MTGSCGNVNNLNEAALLTLFLVCSFQKLFLSRCRKWCHKILMKHVLLFIFFLHIYFNIVIFHCYTHKKNLPEKKKNSSIVLVKFFSNTILSSCWSILRFYQSPVSCKHLYSLREFYCALFPQFFKKQRKPISLMFPSFSTCSKTFLFFSCFKRHGTHVSQGVRLTTRPSAGLYF